MTLPPILLAAILLGSDDVPDESPGRLLFEKAVRANVHLYSELAALGKAGLQQG